MVSMERNSSIDPELAAFLEERKRMSEKAFKRIMKLCKKMKKIEMNNS
jgi:hypothetical protein